MDFDQKKVFSLQLRLDLKLFPFFIVIGVIY